jgi:hypothetical protein
MGKQPSLKERLTAAAGVDVNLSADASPMGGSSNNCPFCNIFYNLNRTSEADVAVEQRTFKNLLQVATFTTPRRVVLKSTRQ